MNPAFLYDDTNNSLLHINNTDTASNDIITNKLNNISLIINDNKIKIEQILKYVNNINDKLSQYEIEEPEEEAIEEPTEEAGEEEPTEEVEEPTVEEVGESEEPTVEEVVEEVGESEEPTVEEVVEEVGEAEEPTVEEVVEEVGEAEEPTVEEVVEAEEESVEKVYLSIKSISTEGLPINVDDIDFSGGILEKSKNNIIDESVDVSEIIVKPKRKYTRRKK
jgi:hypothetical protein